MRKSITLVVLALLVIVAFAVYMRNGEPAARPDQAQMGFGGGPGGRGGSMIGRVPMTVDLYKASRATVSERILVVGNLVGAATVEVAPRTSGRLQSISVRIGDRVRRGQPIAQIEDREIREQVKQSEASYEVSKATIRQREADLRLAEANAERSRSLFQRNLIAKQALDDAEARLQAAQAQADLSRAQFQQAAARLEELRITLANTVIVSPVDGFVGRRGFDPGAWVGPNSPVASVVDIHLVRLVANLVEKDLRRVNAGDAADVEVDAYPGEIFKGTIARVAPVLDPATRTAQMEVEIPNPDFRLKPGMYARITVTVSRKENALVVPLNALVLVGEQQGVFLPENQVAKFRPLRIGLQDREQVEVVEGLSDGETVITTGSAALKDGDRILLPGQQADGATPGQANPGRGGRGRGGRGEGGRGRATDGPRPANNTK
ncbi:MAG: efflux RND transporter periplasmic adaptor subunit [Vicinamibacterales bacterium]